MSKSTLEKIAYGQATARFVSKDNNFEGTWYDRYEFLVDSVSKDEEPVGWCQRELEPWPWKVIVRQIDDEAESFLDSLKNVMSLAHKGIVKSAIDCTLDSDMNCLNLEQMVELGYQEEFGM